MLEVKNLRKTFGELVAVDDLSFTIEDGEILGFIGQNGSGKTTTFRLILDFLMQDSGSVLWNGKPLSSDEYNIIGYLPEERGLYPKDSIETQLRFFGQLRGKTRKEIDEKIDYWMEKFEVKGKRTDKVKTLSKGNQQKVQLIATLIHEPKLVILDEPFSGLDPVNAELLKTAVAELREQKVCVVFSDHNMMNVEKMVDKMIMVKEGKKILDGTVDAVRQSFGRTKVFIEAPVSEEELVQLEGVKEVQVERNGTYELTLENEAAGKAVFDYVTQSGYIQMFSQQPPSLEEIFKMKAGDAHE
ncbi:ABC transporter ATP-binding protein [Lactococcus garvieae subsp. garvieae]|uniref:ABC transporter ATP-binding protein n=1 Tax=Lactococcus garvieae TaxID=1363 RepID=UPI0005A70089|nr:ABC transporter ATP-binding protein [Lactococcus garvieae]KAA8712259.1 ABC transporter ATP-binding protein [Lactococcus garvieae subsp. garvieae]MDG6191663.1 ABC transporter ATP-binding protein [Lactococcus garvieae]PCS02236.1 sodium ABC transporter ATP-binding protein [Lactococcus garvieae]QPR48620.1 ABC transporter ATP-binding protein [Lactococcus garvieae]UKS68951.1 ABC transporter ATP-binding protein [Lactococcus garvieae]